MRLILHILQKDLRRLWPLVLVWWGVLALQAAFPFLILSSPHGSDDVVILYLAQTIADLVLVVAMATSLIEADSPINDRAFWRTLPLPRGRMFVAKGLFALLFLVLPALAFTLATRAIYRFPPAEWLDGLVLYTILRVGVVVVAFAVPCLFRRPVQAYIAIVMAVLVFVFSTVLFPRDYSGEYWKWALYREIAALYLTILGVGVFISGAYLARSRRGLSLQLLAAGLLVAGLYLKMMRGGNAGAFADLDTTRGALESLPFILAGLVAGFVIYSRFQRLRGVLILLIGLFATINVIAWVPVPDDDGAVNSRLDPLVLPPGNTITARVVPNPEVTRVSADPTLPEGSYIDSQGNFYGSYPGPELIFESHASGNVSIFDPNKVWSLGYTSLKIRWPDSGAVERQGSGSGTGNWNGGILSLLTGLTPPHSVPPLESVWKGILSDLGSDSRARLQREPAIIEGRARFTVCSFEKLGDLPLHRGAAARSGSFWAICQSAAAGTDRNSGAYEALSLTALVPNESEADVIYLGHAMTDTLLVVLWNASRQEFAVVERGSPPENTRFVENGVVFNLANFALTARLPEPPVTFDAVTHRPTYPPPPTPAETDAWLAGARLLIYRCTPHYYYFPFKTEPFVLPAAP